MLVSLRLSPEEAIFLAHATDNMQFYYETIGLSSLEVKPIPFLLLLLEHKAYKAGMQCQEEHEEVVVSTQDTWHRCVSYSLSFVHDYIAYHHYRSKVRRTRRAT